MGVDMVWAVTDKEMEGQGEGNDCTRDSHPHHKLERVDHRHPAG